ncbi:phenylalanine--tRNA ligase subunit alpha, partial [Candidatus Daviesbacteria bacterium]|nr:phenylalanine--tRNA ligase subunit alpha [Candidatus Daviesbacteria bacterium]
MEEKINQILQKYSDQIAQAENLKQLDQIFLALFGKNGEVTLLPKEFPKLEKDQLKTITPLFNKTKNELEKSVDQKRSEIREEGYKKLASEDFDLEKAQEVELGLGHLHPQTQFEKEIADLFRKIGFAQYDSPHIDSDFNNFEVLNIPEDHPARDLWDTLYLENDSQNETKLLLRTHTSNSQIRIMQKFRPPIRMMDIGRCFRYENIDARHEHTFDQFEIVVVEKGLSMANLLYLSNYFLKNIFGPEIKARLRPKYYPFVEPGAGVDGLCMLCRGGGRLPDGQGCK